MGMVKNHNGDGIVEVGEVPRGDFLIHATGIPRQRVNTDYSPFGVAKVLYARGKISKSAYRKAARHGRASEDTAQRLYMLSCKQTISPRHRAASKQGCRVTIEICGSPVNVTILGSYAHLFSICHTPGDTALITDIIKGGVVDAIRKAHNATPKAIRGVNE